MFQIPQSPLREPARRDAGDGYQQRDAGVSLFDRMPNYANSAEGKRASTAGIALRAGVLSGGAAVPPAYETSETTFVRTKVPGMIDRAGRPTRDLGAVLFDSPDRRGLRRTITSPVDDMPTLASHIHHAGLPSTRSKDLTALNSKHAQILASDPKAFYRRDGDFVRYVGNIAQHRLFVSSQPSDLRITPHERAVQRLTKAASESTIRSLQQKVLLNNGSTASLNASLLGGGGGGMMMAESSLSLMADGSTLSNNNNHHQQMNQEHRYHQQQHQQQAAIMAGEAFVSANASETEDGSFQYYPFTAAGGGREGHHQHEQARGAQAMPAEEFAIRTGQLMAVETTKGEVLTVGLPPLPKYLQPVAVQHNQQRQQQQQQQHQHTFARQGHTASTGLLAASGGASPRTIAALSGTVLSSGGKWSGTSIKPALAALEGKPPELVQQSLSTNASNADMKGVAAAADSALRNAYYAIGRSGSGPSARAGGQAFRKHFPHPAASSHQQPGDQPTSGPSPLLRTSIGQPIPFAAAKAGELAEAMGSSARSEPNSASSPRSAFGPNSGSGRAVSVDPALLATAGLHTREGAAAFSNSHHTLQQQALSLDMTASPSKRRGDPAGLVPTAGGGASTSRAEAPFSYSSSAATAAERALGGSHLVSLVAGHRAAAGTDLPSLRPLDPADAAGTGNHGNNGLLFTSRSSATASFADPATRAGHRLHDGGTVSNSLTNRAILAVASKTAHELALGLHGTTDKVSENLRFEAAGEGAVAAGLNDDVSTHSQGSVGLLYFQQQGSRASASSEAVPGARTMTGNELATSARLLSLRSTESASLPVGSPSGSPPPLSVGHGTTMLPAVAAAATVSAVLLGTGAAPPAEVAMFTPDSSLRHAARAGVTAAGVLSTSRPGTATIVGGREPHPVTGESIDSLGGKRGGRSKSPKAHEVLSATLRSASSSQAGQPVIDTSSLLQPALPVAVSDPLSEKIWRQAVSQRRSSIQAKGYSIFEEESQLKAKALSDATSATGSRAARRSPNRLRINSKEDQQQGQEGGSYRGQDGRPVSPTIARASPTQLVAGDGRYLARSPPTRERYGGGRVNALTSAVVQTLDEFEGRLQSWTSSLNNSSVARRTYEV